MSRSTRRAKAISFKRYFRILVFASVLGSFMLLFSTLSVGAKINDANVIPTEKYYTSISVTSGDTLWELADEYMSDEYDSKQDYLNEIISLNHLDNGEIHAGENIVIPYYDVAGK